MGHLSSSPSFWTWKHQGLSILAASDIAKILFFPAFVLTVTLCRASASSVGFGGEIKQPFSRFIVRRIWARARIAECVMATINLDGSHGTGCGRKKQYKILKFVSSLKLAARNPLVSTKPRHHSKPSPPQLNPKKSLRKPTKTLATSPIQASSNTTQNRMPLPPHFNP
ncbi:xyloglucan endotransglucosylase/hydrolase 16 [Striga asiatica]|uniref:Xyloglucan endotransglucosylase/hydrolase 16 n=1 Tax=Striga asiatica TaxID=4170 RepID=A0A5A7PAU0_STRAF|nr:xyloglucan endotransglucosylase/hydrolase 16 [Striga asiatica]